jgi:topoisomerase-4 subunit A
MTDKDIIVLDEKADDSYIELNPYFEQKYMEYTISVLKSRAIPYLADGLKPVQRRVIYAMMVLGNYYSEKHKKSARIVGDVIGKYHPHGDTSVYETAVRMSQNWVMRYPLIDGQGNFGSRDGDNAAAMRYTESRLTQFAEDVFLGDLGKETVNFKPNFDSSLTEPELFPSKLNTLLLNGASGIAVAMATEIPSHNMREINAATIALLENPNLDLDAVMNYITGPDFATGGQIIDNKETIKAMYETGRGTIRVRARWKIEQLSKGNWQAVIYELPPQQSIKKVLEKINSLQNPVQKIDPKTKKPLPLGAKQQTEKAFISNLFEKVSDGSDRNESMRIVFIPKNKKQDPEQFMHSILNVLDLQESYSANMTTVGLDGRPICKNLLTILNEWNEFRFNTITKRCLYELKKAEDRSHILDGRMIAFLHIDEVIKIIKESDEPKTELMQKFSLSEIQAEDILEIKLRQLARLEAVKIEKELEQLRKAIARLNTLLNNKKKMNQLIIEEIRELDNKYGDDRKTIISEDNRELAGAKEIVSEEPISVYFTDKGWITSRKGHNIENENIPTKPDDKIIHSVECLSTEDVGFLGSDGRGYSVKVSDIPSGKTGYVHINTLISPAGGVKLKGMTVCRKNIKMLAFGANGYGFISSTENLSTRMKAGKAFLTLDENEDLMEPIIIQPTDKYIAIRTSDNRLLTYTIDQIKELDKGKGVILAKLDNSSILEVILYEKSFYVKRKNKWHEIVNEGTIEFSVNRGSKGKVHNDILSIARSVQ